MAQHLKIRRSSRYFSLHTHSRYSFNDALPGVAEIVKRAHELGYPALAITDHGNMGASVQLYMECKKYGIKPMPGSELYLVKDRSDKRAKRYHVGVVAYTTTGYRNLIHLSTLSHQNFHHKPLLDLADLATLAAEGRTEGLALTTGCYFSLVIQTLINDGYAACKQLISTLSMWFETYVEIQDHNIDHEIRLSEDMIAKLLLRIANELGLAVVITQDSHYVHESDKTDHETLKELVSWSTDADDAKFPGDGFHMVDEQWMKEHHSPEIYEAGITGLQHLLDRWDMHIPEMDEYHFKMPKIHPDPMEELSSRCSEELRIRTDGRGPWTRLHEELDVIRSAGMADYLLMVADVCQHMRDVKMFFQIRGSAAGSLVCLLLGINEHDPLRWDLRFDRFLTKDRTKPPDIDIDIEHDRRKELMEWIATQWSVVQICSWGTYSLSGESDKGSLRVKYLSRMRKITGQADWKTAPEEDKRQLFRLSDLGLISNPGVHAAGLVITSSQEEMDTYVPRQWIASSKTWVSQYDMKDVEKIGLVKLDVLGVKMLSVLRRTILNLGLDPADGLGFIPYNDRKTYSMLSKGDTAAVFQLEGYTSQKNIQRLRPTKLDDVIASMALFRPGVMKSGAMDSYLRRRHREEKLPKRHKIISEATDFTYGILLYQDQVIAVLRALGMNTDDLNKYLNAVKASNKNVAAAKVTMEKLEPEVKDLCFKAGMTDEDYAWLQEALKAFADYSFNRAHATVYGITAYRCAWLARNHPLEYHAAVLVVAAGTDKEDEYKRVTRSRGLRILKPDVNASKATYTVDLKTQSIRKGLLAIEGVGPVVAREIENHQPYRSVEDLCERVNPTKVSGSYAYLENKDTSVGKLAVLFSSGAMRSLIGG
jgi:DNA polymerase III subunit alpha